MMAAKTSWHRHGTKLRHRHRMYKLNRNLTAISPTLALNFSHDHNPNHGSFVLLYADDILLISSSVSELQNLVTACEKVLLALDMSLNVGSSRVVRHNSSVVGALVVC